MQVESIADALAMYKKHLESKETIISAKQIYDQTLTALTRYTLPGWGHPAPNGRKPTRIEKEGALIYLANASINKLEQAQEIQEKTFQALNATNEQKYTYSSRLDKFIEWVKQAGLIKNTRKSKSNITTGFYHGHGSATHKRKTEKKKLPSYSLKSKDAPACLVSEIEQFKKFLLDKVYPGRKFKPLKNESCANKYIDVLYRIIGWYQSTHSFCGNFTLNLLVPQPTHKIKVNRNDFLQEAEETAEFIDNWICELINFMETERNCKPGTIVNAFKVINLLIKYRYLKDTQRNDFKDIPAIDVVRNYMSIFSKQGEKLKPEENSNDSMSWLDLPDIITKIILPLKIQTNYRTRACNLRAISSITRSFVDFIIWGLFTFRPPRRQQEWREMKIGLSCLIPKEPYKIAENEFIHPLPSDRNKDLRHGYLYKTVDGKWFKDTPPESYKTGDTYGYQQLEIPNTPLGDGEYFYDYLEAYLYGYYRDKKGNWISGGQLTDNDLAKKPQPGQWYSLRMAYNPQHNFVFFGSDKAEPYNDSNFGRMFWTIANRLTGKMINPHLLRDIYATWFLDQGYTQDRIASLAYAMGHSEAMMRKDYDKRKSHQKNRPIEEELGKLMDQFINNSYVSPSGSTTSSSSSTSTPKPIQNDIDRIMAVLTPEQKRDLGFD